MPGIRSPNANNYVVGKGFLIFTYLNGPNAGQAFHLGNCPKAVYTPAVSVAPHFSSMAGTKVQDFSTILQLGGKCAVDMEELTANNLALFFNGVVDSSHPDAVHVGIYDALSQIEGQLQYYATNSIGPRWNWNLTRVLCNPTGNYSPISDTYNAMTVEFTHVIDDEGLFGTMTLQPDISTITPQNILVPFIDGPLHLGDVPAFAQVGEIMVANVGQWVGAQGYAYQWSNSSGVIGGATSKTYIPVSGDIGKTLTVAVTARNPNGNTTVSSGVTLAVHA
jgi:hypothetical protein